MKTGTGALFFLSVKDTPPARLDFTLVTEPGSHQMRPCIASALFSFLSSACCCSSWGRRAPQGTSVWAPPTPVTHAPPPPPRRLRNFGDMPRGRGGGSPRMSRRRHGAGAFTAGGPRSTETQDPDAAKRAPQGRRCVRCAPPVHRGPVHRRATAVPDRRPPPRASLE